MYSIIVAFPKSEDGNKIKGMLIRSGFEVYGVCTSGSMVLQMAEELERGIVVSGCKFQDMNCRDIKENLPPGLSLLVLASKQVWETYEGEGIIFQEMPFKLHELVNTLEMMIRISEKHRKKVRSKSPRQKNADEKALILKAKIMLMEKNNLTEEEAYRYIQKNSMDSGNSMSDTAYMLLSIMGYMQ